MEKIQMVDLHNQYLNIKGDIDNAVLSCIERGGSITGSAVKEFQTNLKKYLGINHLITCAYGTGFEDSAVINFNFIDGVWGHLIIQLQSGIRI